MNCLTCGVAIDAERLEALPTTRHCTEHSTYKQPLVLMTYSHKTAGVPVIIDRNGAGGPERERIARRAHRRAR